MTHERYQPRIRKNTVLSEPAQKLLAYFVKQDANKIVFISNKNKSKVIGDSSLTKTVIELRRKGVIIYEDRAKKSKGYYLGSPVLFEEEKNEK